MIDQFFSNPKVLKRLHSGPLGTHIDSFAQVLRVQGYQNNTAKYKIGLVGELSRWLKQRGLSVKDLDEIMLNEFLKSGSQRRNFAQKDIKERKKHQLNKVREYLKQNL